MKTATGGWRIETYWYVRHAVEGPVHFGPIAYSTYPEKAAIRGVTQFRSKWAARKVLDAWFPKHTPAWRKQFRIVKVTRRRKA